MVSNWSTQLQHGCGVSASKERVAHLTQHLYVAAQHSSALPPKLWRCAGMLNDLSDLSAAGGGGGDAGSANGSEALAMRYNDPVLETLALQRLKELAPLVRGHARRMFPTKWYICDRSRASSASRRPQHLLIEVP